MTPAGPSHYLHGYPSRQSVAPGERVEVLLEVLGGRVPARPEVLVAL